MGGVRKKGEGGGVEKVRKGVFTIDQGGVEGGEAKESVMKNNTVIREKSL